MAKTKTNHPAIDQFYEFCYTNNKVTEDIVDKILVLAAINNDEITDVMLRGYLPMAWSACVRIAQAMETFRIAKYVEHFSDPVVHLPFEERDGWWRTVES